MVDLTVADVVLALKQFHIDANSALLRRIEWELGEGNQQWTEERLKEELCDFVLRRSHTWKPSSYQLSLDDFLCDKGISAWFIWSRRAT